MKPPLIHHIISAAATTVFSSTISPASVGIFSFSALAAGYLLASLASFDFHLSSLNFCLDVSLLLLLLLHLASRSQLRERRLLDTQSLALSLCLCPSKQVTILDDSCDGACPMKQGPLAKNAEALLHDTNKSALLKKRKP